MVWLPVSVILTCRQMLMHAMSHWAVWLQQDSLHRKLTLGEKSLVTPRSRARVSMPPGASATLSTHYCAMSDGFKDIRCLNFCAAKSETDLFSCVLGWLGFVYWDSRHQICCHKLNNMKASVICVISMCWAGWAWYVGVRDINIAAAKRPAWTSVICVISKVIQRCGIQENCPSDVSFIGLIFWIFFLPLVWFAWVWASFVELYVKT